jgi:hypothetical protein
MPLSAHGATDDIESALRMVDFLAFVGVDLARRGQ